MGKNSREKSYQRGGKKSLKSRIQIIIAQNKLIIKIGVRKTDKNFFSSGIKCLNLFLRCICLMRVLIDKFITNL